jgi:hypothetical protein
MIRRYQFLADEQQLKYGFGNHSVTTTTSRVLWDARRVYEHEQSPIVELVQRFQNLTSPFRAGFRTMSEARGDHRFQNAAKPGSDQ